MANNRRNNSRRNNNQGNNNQNQEVQPFLEQIFTPIKNKINGVLGKISRTKYKHIIIIPAIVYGLVLGFNFLVQPFAEAIDNFNFIQETVRPQDEVTVEDYDKKIGEIISINDEFIESKDEIIEQKNDIIKDKEVIIELQSKELQEKDNKIIELEQQLKSLKK